MTTDTGARLAAIVASSSDAIVGLTREGTISDWNAAAEKLYGYRAGEVIGRHPAFLEPSTRSGEWAELWKLVMSGERVSELETLRRRKDGSEIEVSLTVSPIQDESGNTVGCAEIARDISERRRAQKRFEAILEAAPDAIVAVDSGGKIVLVNGRVEQLFGYRRDELLGESVQILVPERFRAKHREQVDGFVKAAGSRRLHAGRELRARRKDGSTFDVEITLSPVESTADGMTIVAAIRDVTDRNKMREQLILSDRMVSIGTLAAGVAHEINNPLAVVITNVDLALNGLADLGSGEPGLEEIREELADAREGADRVRKIVRDLKIFARSEDDQLKAVDVRSVMESSLRMASNEIRHRARLVTDYADEAFVHASDSRLGQVFLNILVNAAQAIPEGRADSNEIRVTTSLDADGHVVISIADTGLGMQPEIVSRLFTPFFTTKPVGVGTGLGLSICQRLVKNFGGQIAVESTPGQGTTFRIVLPVASPDADPEEDPIVSAPASRRGRILIVDDEKLVGRTMRRALESRHDVTATTNAREALARIEAGERFDVILCDLMMPDMTGMDFHAALLGLTPSLASQMIFLTGGAFTPLARAFLEKTTNAWLEKPFDIEQTLVLIEERLR